MYGMPSDFAPTGFDTSMLLMSGYLLGGLAVLILGGDDARHRSRCRRSSSILFVIDQIGRRLVAHATGWFPAKLVLIMFRGLQAQPAAHVAHLPRALRPDAGALPHLRGPHMIGNATTREGGELQGHRHAQDDDPQPDAAGLLRPSSSDCCSMRRTWPPEHLQPVNGDKDIMSWSFVLGTTDKVNPRKDNDGVPVRARAGQGDDDDGRPRRPDRRGKGTARAGRATR